MRHFFLPPLAISVLASGMAEGAPVRPLVTPAGSVQGVSPGKGRAGTTVDISSVAIAAKADLAATAPTVEQAVCRFHPASAAMTGWTRQGKWAMLNESAPPGDGQEARDGKMSGLRFFSGVETLSQSMG